MSFTLPACLFYITLSLIMFSCHSHLLPPDKVAGSVIVVQPFSDFSPLKATAVYKMIKEINAATIIRTAIPLPPKAYYPLRNRYKADSIIQYLGHFGSTDTIIIGLTGKDISTTKGKIADWGVMGLGLCPGNACVVSAFRLSGDSLSNQFYKITIHELGHTQGLIHCNNDTCFMRDANGRNPLNEEKDFCPSCKSFLQGKGWRLK